MGNAQIEMSIWYDISTDYGYWHKYKHNQNYDDILTHARARATLLK